MSRRNLSDEWRLEETGESEAQWNLQPAEQRATAQWQINPAGEPSTEWQPVDYVRDQGAGRGNWILPALVGIALVAVIAYAAWIGLDRLGVFDTTGVLPPATSEPTSVQVAQDATPTLAPTNTPPPPTPTLTPTLEPTATPTLEPSPTPIPVVSLASIVVSAEGGVNGRQEPNTTSQVLKLLAKDEKYLVNEDRGDWVQVALAPNQLAWVFAEFVQRSAETVTLDDANRRRAEVGLAALAPPAAPLIPSIVITSATPPTTTTPLSLTGAITIAPPAAPLAPTPTVITVTIAITAGLNAREAPNRDAAVVQLLEGGRSFVALLRSADNQWVQVALPDGRKAWLFAQFVTPSGDLNTLPPDVAPPPPAGATTTITNSAPVTVVSGATASVIAIAGTNARARPSQDSEPPLQVLPFDTVWRVVGRSADNQWVQVPLEEGRLAWVLMETIKLSSPIESLPVVNP
jgi:uncharacterized protein YgiM (DUF1202 family)